MGTLADLFVRADRTEAAVILPDGGGEIGYAALANQVERLALQLRQVGLEPGQVVAIVLPDGLESLVSFLAVTWARLVAAPLNSVYKAEEFRFFLQDSGARAVIAMPEANPVLDAARLLRLPVWVASRNQGNEVQLVGASLHAPSRFVRDALDAPRPADTALFLYTSGTTGRPKGVPLTHGNILASVHNTASHYALSPADTGLVVMPLFHVHGLIGATLSALYAGSKIVLPERFHAHTFWPLVKAHAVSWYSAVPTIHQILLSRAESDNAPARSGFRFVRSCSAALAPATLEQLESRFGAPVLEAYAMTEASHQMTSNPLPPQTHKAGSVGQGANVDVAIMNGRGDFLRSGTEGEVVVRGDNVMHGYSRASKPDTEANEAAFIKGWFRTGDLGVLDGDGYLKLTGRIKELINRGGEKISPMEVDAVLLSDPAVVEAAAFGVPDPFYGEEIQAAVVPRGELTASELMAYCRDRLPDFKIPKAFHFVNELPKSATGKIERRRLTDLFSTTGAAGAR